jgi:hypothetical protein
MFVNIRIDSRRGDRAPAPAMIADNPVRALPKRRIVGPRDRPRREHDGMSEDNKKAKADAAPAAPDDTRLGRRLFFFRVATVLGGAAATAVGGSGRARAQESDSDQGPDADPPSKGRRAGGGGSDSNTDSDWGPKRDPVGGKRRAEPKRLGGNGGMTDSDSGPEADPAGRGKGKK